MRRSLPRLVLLLVVILVIAFLAYRSRGAIQIRGFSWDVLASTIKHARISLLLLSIGALYVTLALRSFRWKAFSRYLERASFWNIYRSTIIGFTGVFLLGRVGEPIRPLLVARKDRVPVSSEFGIYLLERLFDAATSAVLAGLALLVFPSLMQSQGSSGTVMAAARTTGIVLMAGLAAAIVALVYFRFQGAATLSRTLEVWRAQPGARRKLAGLLGGLSEGLQAIRTGRDLLEAILWTAVHWAIVALIYLWTMHSFGGRLAELGMPAAMLILVFSMVGSAVQLPAVGGGSQALTFIALTQVFGVEKEPAAAASVVIWLVTFAACGLVGVPLLIHEGWSMGELKHLAQAERAAEAAGSHIAAAEAKPHPAPKKDSGAAR